MENKQEIKEGYITSFDGIKLYFKKLGVKPKTIIIPLASWPWYEALSNYFTIIAYDPRNRGRSEAVPYDLIGLDFDIKDIDVIREYFNLDKISLIGWSMFGGVIIHYTLKYGKFVKNLIQVCPMSPKRSGYKQRTILKRDSSKLMTELKKMENSKMQKTEPEKYLRLFWKSRMLNRINDPSLFDEYDFPFKCENELPQNVFPFLVKYLENLGDYNWINSLSSIFARVLTIHGDLDTIPLQASKDWVKYIPNARLLVMENVGHWPALEAKERFYVSIIDFFKGKWPRGSQKAI